MLFLRKERVVMENLNEYCGLINELSIQPSKDGEEWVFSVNELEGVRVLKLDDVKPYSTGVLYYPAEWDVKRGFEILKAYMIDNHEIKIRRLTSSLSKLIDLKYGEGDNA
jgi:hypothetical protein